MNQGPCLGSVPSLSPKLLPVDASSALALADEGRAKTKQRADGRTVRVAQQ